MMTTDLTRIIVPISRDEAQMIYALARKEFRHPRAQARLLIYEALRARGIIVETHQSDAAPRGEGVKHAATS